MKRNVIITAIVLGFLAGCRPADTNVETRRAADIGFQGKPTPPAPSQPPPSKFISPQEIVGKMQPAEAKAALMRLMKPSKLTSQDKQRVEKLIRDLGGEKWKVRKKATEGLILLGQKAVPQVQQAAKGRDLEVSIRAKLILKTIQIRLDNSDAVIKVAIDTLCATGDKQLLSLLIQLLEHADIEVRYVAEYSLRRLAGKNFGYNSYDDPPKRIRAIAKWKQWWKQNEAGFVFKKAKTSDKSFGVLVCTGNKILLVSPAGTIVWSRKVKQSADCAAGLSNGNVLVGSKRGQIVEYGPDFKQVWKYDTPCLISMYGRPRPAWKHGIPCVRDVSRLRNGNTLIACPPTRCVLEVTPAGKVAWQQKNVQSAKSAQRLSNGNTLITGAAGVIEVTRSGKIVWRRMGMDTTDARKLPNGNVLIADNTRISKVVEVNRAGRTVWQRECRGSLLSVCRLPDGTTVIGSNLDGKGVIFMDHGEEDLRSVAKFGSGLLRIRVVPAALMKRKESTTSTQQSGGLRPK